MGRRAIGPFTVRQLLLALGSVAVAAVVLSLATRPLGGTEASQIRDPRATAFLIGSPTTGLQPGSVAPELAASRADGTTFQLADLDGQIGRAHV